MFLQKLLFMYLLHSERQRTIGRRILTFPVSAYLQQNFRQGIIVVIFHINESFSIILLLLLVFFFFF